MVVIRLARHGRHKYPTYRIVAADKRRAATGKFLAILGTYNPHTKEVSLKKEEIQQYLSNGAQASDRVLRILKSQKITLPAWATIHDRKKPPKKTQEATDKAPATDAPAQSPAKDEETVAQVATDQAIVTEEKSTQVKDDKGSAKELDDKAEAQKATEKTAEAAEATQAKEVEAKKE